MKKASILPILILALALITTGCGGGGGSSSGSVPGGTSSADSSGGPASSDPSPSSPSSPDTVNSAPVANAGIDQTVSRGTVAYLDGSASSDPDGDLLSFQWTILSQPGGSTVTLSKADEPLPYFTPDQDGDYVIQLVVVDAKGLASSPDTITVSTSNSAPIADAGPDQSVALPGTTVTLGGESWDPDGDSIVYSWNIRSKPEGSVAVLSDPASPTPTFVADVYGDYLIELVVSDAWASSAPDAVKVSFGNLKPVANAGNSFATARGTVAYLDGSASYDPNGDPLTYQWSFAYKPAGSTADLVAATTVNPSFTPDLAGTYVVSLVVSDGLEKSDPGSATITVFSTINKPIQELLYGLEDLNSLPSNVFKNRNMKNKLANKINAVIADIDSGYYQTALGELETDILKKMDGCARKGAPERNDWITDCGAQGAVYPHITSAVDLLKNP